MIENLWYDLQVLGVQVDGPANVFWDNIVVVTITIMKQL